MLQNLCYNWRRWRVRPLSYSAPQEPSPVTRNRSRWAILFVVASAALLLAAAACAASTANDSQSSESLSDLPPEFQRMEEVWLLLQREHIDGGTLDAETLSDGAIRGMLQALDDPYAAFLTAEQFSIDSQDIKGFFEGIPSPLGDSPQKPRPRVN